MNSSVSTTANHLTEVVRLLEQIVVAFKDAYSRPETQIGFYRRYQELRKRHNAKLVGRFIVIPGGRKRPPSPSVRPATIVKRQNLRVRTRLTVIASDVNTSVSRSLPA